MKTAFRTITAATLAFVLLAGCDESPTAPAVPAPDLTGVWVGTLSHSSDPHSNVWQARLDLTHFHGNAEGYLVGELTTSSRGALLRMSVTGQVDVADVLIQDKEIRESRHPGGGFYWCEDREFDLEYREVQGRGRLQGRWTTSSPGCEGGSVTLERQ